MTPTRSAPLTPPPPGRSPTVEIGATANPDPAQRVAWRQLWRLLLCVLPQAGDRDDEAV